jgi:hypothetical protein
MDTRSLAILLIFLTVIIGTTIFLYFFRTSPQIGPTGLAGSGTTPGPGGPQGPTGPTGLSGLGSALQYEFTPITIQDRVSTEGQKGTPTSKLYNQLIAPAQPDNDGTYQLLLKEDSQLQEGDTFVILNQGANANLKVVSDYYLDSQGNSFDHDLDSGWLAVYILGSNQRLYRAQNQLKASENPC